MSEQQLLDNKEGEGGDIEMGDVKVVEDPVDNSNVPEQV